MQEGKTMSKLNTGPTRARTRARTRVRVITLFTILFLALALLAALPGEARSTSALPSSVSNQATPNAGLSNEELVNKALENMTTLKSYGFEVVGIEPAGAVTPTYSVTLTGYEQPPGKALIVSARGKIVGVNNYSLIGIFADEAQQAPHEMISLAESLFISFDGGITWKPFSSNGGYFVPPTPRGYPSGRWNWSGLNQDFGEVEAPLTETVR
jgi:hypothetical protein